MNIEADEQRIIARDYATTSKLFHHIVQQESAFGADLERRGILKIFRLLGDQHLLTRKYRAILQQPV